MRADQRLSAALIVALAAIFAVGGWVLFGRRADREGRLRMLEQRRRDRQAEFARTMQVMDTELEAHGLVRRHLERTLPDTSVVVLQRNAGADRLEAATSVAPETPLALELADAQPRSCLAVRVGRPHEEAGDRSLLSCEICGATGAERTLCTPLVVSGEVIGSVLVGHDGDLPDAAAQIVEDTVTQAAPVLANMRNLALAEQRASTDALTGLANRRAMQDTLRRLMAQSQRSGASMATIAMDVDHFKSINDTFGHDRGDDVLAAIGEALTAALRASDFVSRPGGEEFVVLLPDTGLDGALIAADNLRQAIAAIHVAGVDRRLTASFGVAIYPDDGAEPGTLLRRADKALYVAKARGRDRVEAAAAADARSAQSAA